MSITYSRGNPSLYAEPMPGAETLYDMAELLLLRIGSCFTEKGVALPERQIIYMTPAVADCEQVLVMFTGWTPDQQWDGTTTCNSFRWLAGFSLVITRCSPAIPSRKGTAPTVQQMNAAARMASIDAEGLLCVVNSVGELGTDLSIITTAPQGGFQSVECDLQIPAFGGLE